MMHLRRASPKYNPSSREQLMSVNKSKERKRHFVTSINRSSTTVVLHYVCRSCFFTGVVLSTKGSQDLRLTAEEKFSCTRDCFTLLMIDYRPVVNKSSTKNTYIFTMLSTILMCVNVVMWSSAPRGRLGNKSSKVRNDQLNFTNHVSTSTNDQPVQALGDGCIILSIEIMNLEMYERVFTREGRKWEEKRTRINNATVVAIERRMVWKRWMWCHNWDEADVICAI